MKARDNPFAVDRVLRVRYELPHCTLAELVERLIEQRGRGAIVGPHGSGKTTLMEDLAGHLQSRGARVHLLRLSAERRTLPRESIRRLSDRLDADDAVLCDGAEQLTWPSWWWWLKRRVRTAGMFVVTTHRPGCLPTLLETRTTPELLESIIRRLLAHPNEPLPFDVAELFERHAGNVRDALRELYDRYAAGEFTERSLHQRALLR